ncbi:phage major capsid protein [Bifidobacterium pseudocatenulatum]|uniref:phage major capsid protein n=1 Tax=Bifidobacterium pseudocatenulatum TaxID=28026 RepID=UPI00080BECD5|nr:phage major capsid protein [Bifidobacterium pseudocatenulatum]UDG84223.1 phage major capsid protein [Bifidobacterium pseudocatenulatum]UDG85334.1 phage major capsid protein [Bifidobacterium pseudocatenulatum]
MASLKEKRAALVKQLEEKQGLLAAGKADGDTIAFVKNALAEVEGIDRQMDGMKQSDDLLTQIGQLNAKSGVQHVGGSDAIHAKSVGEYYVKSMQTAGFDVKSAIAHGYEVECKANTDTNVEGAPSAGYKPYLTQTDTEPARPYQRPLVVADLFSAGAITGTVLQYPVFDELEGNAKMVEETGAAPQVHWKDPVWKQDKIGKVASFFGISEDMMDDLSWVIGEINDAAQYDLKLQEESQLLSGDGSENNLTGLFNRGIQTMGQDELSDADRLSKAALQITTTTNFQADAYVMNPLDFWKLTIAKDANGNYLNLTDGAKLWNIPTVATAAITEGTALVGAFKSAKVLRKGGLVVKMTDSDTDDFLHFKQKCRVSERLGLQVKYPKAFVKVTLGKAA